MQTHNIIFSASPRLELDFIDFYCVLLEFEKRTNVNMQEINLEFWIKGRTTKGDKYINFFYFYRLCVPQLPKIKMMPAKLLLST